jgi:hypothetical protein
MGAIEFLLELLIVFIELGTLGADIIAWFKGRPNRAARREAKSRGEVPPPRDAWNTRVIWLTLFFIGLTSYILIRALLK